jgi:hypothetical protein
VIYLAWSSAGAPTLRTLSYCPPLLVSFFYLGQYQKLRSPHDPPRLMLDSGAFSAWNSGGKIDLQAYIEETRNPLWTESVSLDVIGNGEASLAQALHMKSVGSPAFPVFHIGESFEILQEYAKHFEKVGLSCRFGEHESISMKWLSQCFARIWPKKCHSFGWVSERPLLTFPFHSADAASWIVGPLKFGNWKTFGKMSVRRSASRKIYLTPEINYYRSLQERLEVRWKNELEKLENRQPSISENRPIAQSAISI